MKKDEVSSNDGKDGRPAFIIHDGVIYDVSESKMWKNGRHMNRHDAGMDLTDHLAAAPHGPEVFDRITRLGTIESPEDEAVPDPMERWRHLYQLYHPHPMTIHFPIALFHFAAIMQLLFLFTSLQRFEYAAFFSLLGATITMPPAVLAGFLSWWVNYQRTMTRLFRTKLVFSGISFFLATTAVLWRMLVPSVSLDGSLGTVLYSILILLCVPAIVIVAYNGGKITWPV